MKSFKTFNLSKKPIKTCILMKKNLYFGKFPKMFKIRSLECLLDIMSSISGGFQTAVYILGPLWESTVFGAGPEFCEQSGIYNGLMMEQHL